MPPWVLASGSKPCGGNKLAVEAAKSNRLISGRVEICLRKISIQFSLHLHKIKSHLHKIFTLHVDILR